jgi:hypothetical protein
MSAELPPECMHWIYELRGSHAHVAVFYGRSGFTLAKCGDLVFRNEELEEIIAESAGLIEFRQKLVRSHGPISPS